MQGSAWRDNIARQSHHGATSAPPPQPPVLHTAGRPPRQPPPRGGGAPERSRDGLKSQTVKGLLNPRTTMQVLIQKRNKDPGPYLSVYLFHFVSCFLSFFRSLVFFSFSVFFSVLFFSFLFCFLFFSVLFYICLIYLTDLTYKI